jgi:thymidylate synthase
MAIDYKKRLGALFRDLDESKIITVDKKKYKELVSVVYELLYDEEMLNATILPPFDEDIAERKELLSRLPACAKMLENDIHSRRATYCNLYDNNFGKCITLVHIFVRDRKVNINEYYRSQNALKNFDYDYQTASLIMRYMTKALKLTPGNITVFCMSFHKEVKGKNGLRQK